MNQACDYMCNFYQYTSEKTEGKIKNGQSKDNDNTGHTRLRTKTMTTLGTQDLERRQ